MRAYSFCFHPIIPFYTSKLKICAHLYANIVIKSLARMERLFKFSFHFRLFGKLYFFYKRKKTKLFDRFLRIILITVKNDIVEPLRYVMNDSVLAQLSNLFFGPNPHGNSH